MVCVGVSDSGRLPRKHSSAIAIADGPDSRTTASPATPGGVESAQIVSLAEDGILMAVYEFRGMQKTHGEQFWRNLGQVQLAVEHWQELDSTNDRARALCQELSQPVLVTAAHQRTGRGRHGRSWHDLPGSALLMTLGLPVQWNQTQMPTLSLLAAASLGVLEELARIVPAECLRIKYPNDVWLKPPHAPAGKLCGMLVEADYIGAQPSTSLVGIGINITGVPMLSDAPYPIRCLADAAPAALPDATTLAERIAERIVSLLVHHDHQALVERWQEQLQLIGRRVLMRPHQMPVRITAYAADGSLCAERCDTGELLTVRDADSLLYDPFER